MNTRKLPTQDKTLSQQEKRCLKALSIFGNFGISLARLSALTKTPRDQYIDKWISLGYLSADKKSITEAGMKASENAFVVSENKQPEVQKINIVDSILSSLIVDYNRIKERCKKAGNSAGLKAAATRSWKKVVGHANTLSLTEAELSTFA